MVKKPRIRIKIGNHDIAILDKIENHDIEWNYLILELFEFKINKFLIYETSISPLNHTTIRQCSLFKVLCNKKLLDKESIKKNYKISGIISYSNFQKFVTNIGI